MNIFLLGLLALSAAQVTQRTAPSPSPRPAPSPGPGPGPGPETNSGTLGGCTDDANCPNWVQQGFCTNSFYLEQRQKFCPNACGVCNAPPGPGPSSCEDVNKNCVNWILNGFCSSTFYTAAQKKDYCAKSCGLC